MKKENLKFQERHFIGRPHIIMKAAPYHHHHCHFPNNRTTFQQTLSKLHLVVVLFHHPFWFIVIVMLVVPRMIQTFGGNSVGSVVGFLSSTTTIHHHHVTNKNPQRQVLVFHIVSGSPPEFRTTRRRMTSTSTTTTTTWMARRRQQEQRQLQRQQRQQQRLLWGSKQPINSQKQWFHNSNSALLARRRRRHHDETTNEQYGGGGGGGGQQDSELTWERFEFGHSPKSDSRFDATRTTRTTTSNNDDESSLSLASSSSHESLSNNSLTTTNNTVEALEVVRQAEILKDAQSAQECQKLVQAWQQLDPIIVQRATNILRPFITKERIQRIESVLYQRTRQTQFVFENPSNPSNVWACLRTIDSFGLQYVHVLIDSSSSKQYQHAGKGTIVQKRGMRTAMGSAQWLTVQQYHGTTTQTIQQLRKQHSQQQQFRKQDQQDQQQDQQEDQDQQQDQQEDQEKDFILLASDLNSEQHTSIDIRDIDWTKFGNQPIYIVMGNEEHGISNELRSLVDYTFTLPMSGFAESFNLSVATAITLAHLSAASTRTPTRTTPTMSTTTTTATKEVSQQGPLRPGDLTNHEFNCLRLKGFWNSVAQKRMAIALLKREGIVLPQQLV